MQNVSQIMPSQPTSGDGRDAAIKIIGLEKRYGQGDAAFLALDGVNIEIAQNEFFTLLGPSGCGKTTLLRLIAGFDFPTEGQILLNGSDIALLPPFNRPINTVFQNYALFPHMTVAENIGFGLKMQGKPKAKVAERVSAMLRLVKMEALADRRISAISGGQQQRVALARALAPQPKVLLLDEPLSALDYKLRKEMQTELKRLQTETGITFIFVTHDQEEALTMSDRIAVMNRGKVLQVGNPREIYNAPTDRFVADFIGESNFLPAKIVSQTAGLLRAEVSGAILDVRGGVGVTLGQTVTVMIRPEHAVLSSVPTTGAMAATIVDMVFFGTDTHFHTRLADGTEFILRGQNNADGTLAAQVGQQVWLTAQPGAARIVRD